ncbi:MAG: serine/threonine protein kinase [Phormidium sp. BM_Day4_Bin.17]|nr:serine/threonine protein kinase [Phormidium sp. BM_Day4_Bin.17]UCJ12936.1 MAG: serine/threonine protein kinase [Phormidium sp. PBR-2020]
MHEAQPKGTLIHTRYKVLGILGRGGSGFTYRVEDTLTGRQIALKELSFRGLSNWKKLELFEREAQILASLDHPALPDYVDYFQVDTDDNRLFYIAQNIVEGTSLADLVWQGERFTEAEAKRIAKEIVQILQYLHGLNPPVIHRDIKPQNIIRGIDGRIFLVDFGAVQTVYRNTSAMGSTVVGTYGYMAPEQFRGQAIPATDLYGLGATLLCLLTHQNPGDLPHNRLKIDFRPYVSVSESFANWLDTLLEPLIEDRFASACEALAALTHARSPRNLPQVRRKPSGSRIQLSRSQRHLSIYVPPGGLRCETLFLGVFALVWNGFMVMWTGVTLLSGAFIFFLFSIPFCIAGASMIGMFFNNLLGKVVFEVKGDHFTFSREILGLQQTHTGATRDLYDVDLRVAYTRNNIAVKAVTLMEGVRTHKFGMMLSDPEKDWLVAEIKAFIEGQPH